MEDLFKCELTPEQIQAAHNACEIISAVHAPEMAEKIEDYLAFRGQVSNEGFAVANIFSLAKLQAFIGDIWRYNTQAEGDAKIDSVRVYKLLEEYPKGTGNMIEGVLFVPTKINDEDGIVVFSPDAHILASTGLTMLASGTPCPNLCSKSFFVNKPRT